VVVARRRYPKERLARQFPDATVAVSGQRLLTRTRLLFGVRSNGLSFRLARRSLGRWREPQRRLALCLRRCLAVLERAKQSGQAAPASAIAKMR
jgi:hypothetical protein